MRAIVSEVRKIVFARLSEGDDLLESIASVARKSDVNSGFFFLIGTLKEAMLGYYKQGKYVPIEKKGPLEIVSCTGNISADEMKRLVVHGHIVVSDDKADCFGGHVLPGCTIDATGELTLAAAQDGILKRRLDPRRNLHLWNLEESDKI